ncbi:uncharacterized protein METZ01_LOCUS431098, partial [marine metagenome]
MAKEKIYEVPESMKTNALINAKEYEDIYRKSIKDPKKFWASEAKKYLSWQTGWVEVSRSDFTKGKASWFQGAKINAAVNCIDRHLIDKADKPAIIWESN